MSASVRARAAAAAASAGVLVIGWQAVSAGTPAVGTPATRAPGGPAASGSQGGRTAPTAPGARDGATGTSSQRGGRAAPGGSGGQTVTLNVPVGASGTYTGSAATHRFGSVQVTVTVANGRITGLRESLTSDGDRRSDQINSASVPQLRAAILAAASGQVSTISGATYTTRAYLTSLQSALDQAR